MESKRQLKVARMIQKELGEIFQREGSSLYGKAFVTITDVKMTPDLGLAKVYLSIMLSENNLELIRAINGGSSKIRYALGNKIRHQLRTIPDLIFYVDETVEEAIKINGLISGLDIPDEDNEG